MASSSVVSSITFGLSNYLSDLVRKTIIGNTSVLIAIKDKTQRYNGWVVLLSLFIRDVLRELTRTEENTQKLLSEMVPAFIDTQLLKRTQNITNVIKFLSKFLLISSEDRIGGFVFNAYLMIAGIPLFLTNDIKYSIDMVEVLKKDGNKLITKSEINAIETFKLALVGLSSKQVNVTMFVDVLANKVINKSLDVIVSEIETLKNTMLPIRSSIGYSINSQMNSDSDTESSSSEEEGYGIYQTNAEIDADRTLNEANKPSIGAKMDKKSSHKDKKKKSKKDHKKKIGSSIHDESFDDFEAWF